MQYKITPGLEGLFVEAKAKAKKEKKDKDELIVESADEMLPEAPMSSIDEIIKLIDSNNIDSAAQEYLKLTSDDDKAAVRAALAQKAAVEKNFDDAVKRYMDAQETVEEENQEKQEINNPISDLGLNGDEGSNLGNNDQDYDPASIAPNVSGDKSGNPLDPLSASVKEQLTVEAEYHIKHGLDKKAYLNTINTLYGDDNINKEAAAFYDKALAAKQPSSLMKTAAKIDTFLTAAAAYKEQKPDYEGYLKVAAESMSGEEWLRKLAGLNKTAAKLDEAPANNKEHPGQKMFNNGKSTQENGNTPEDFPGNKLFDETNKAVETVFPEGHVTQEQIIKDRTVIKDLSKIKDVNDQTIAVMQPIKVEPVNLGDSAENNMKDFFFNGNNVVRSPESSKTLPAGKPAHTVGDVLVDMDDLSKKAK